MKIGIDIRNIGKKRTGDEVVFFNITKELARLKDKNEYKLFTDITDEETLEKIKDNLEIRDNSNFEIISLRSFNKFVWNFWTIQRHLRTYPVDIYLTQYITPLFVPKRIKIAAIIHDVSFKVHKQFIKKSDLFFLNILIPASFRRTDKIIGVSRFTRDEIVKYYAVDPDKTDWVHNAVSEDFLQQDVSQEKIEAIRNKYGLPEKYILYIGTLQPRKNISTLIEAYAASGQRDIKLVVAGGRGHNFDPEIDNTVKKYNLESDVIFPGFVDEDDKAALMRASFMFCFPSFYEGFGIPILEAMAQKVPVIASDIPPHREIAEEAAVFFDPHNAEDLSRKILKLIEDENLRSRLIVRGAEQIKKFSWKKTAEKIISIIEKTVKDRIRS